MLLPLLLAACFSEVPQPQPLAQGTFDLDLATDSMAVVVETRAPRQLTDDEAATFYVTLADPEMVLWQHKPYADITLADRTQPLGTGYTVMAENITATEAETLNDGWGARRYAGTSDTFDVIASETTHVTVACRMANAALTVTFDDAFTTFFTDYAVTTADTRALKFNADNTGDTPAYAYYNTDPETATVNVPLLITASAGWDGTARISRTLTLRAGHITRLDVRLNSTEPTTGDISVLAVTYDDTFTEGSTTEIILE